MDWRLFSCPTMAGTAGEMSVAELKAEIERLSRELDQASSEKIQSAQLGLVLLEEKSSLQQRCEELEALYENTRHDLDITQEVTGLHSVCALFTFHALIATLTPHKLYPWAFITIHFSSHAGFLLHPCRNIYNLYKYFAYQQYDLHVKFCTLKSVLYLQLWAKTYYCNSVLTGGWWGLHIRYQLSITGLRNIISL